MVNVYERKSNFWTSTKYCKSETSTFTWFVNPFCHLLQYLVPNCGRTFEFHPTDKCWIPRPYVLKLIWFSLNLCSIASVFAFVSQVTGSILTAVVWLLTLSVIGWKVKLLRRVLPAARWGTISAQEMCSSPRFQGVKNFPPPPLEMSSQFKPDISLTSVHNL